jgi:chitinase
MQRNTILGAAVAAVLTIGGTILAVTLTRSAQAVTLPNNWYGAAPYVMPLDNNPPDLSTVMAATGQKSFELAFILAPNGGGCTPTWDGTAPGSSDTVVANVISKVRAAGGDVSVSIGGYNGTKLGQTCPTAATTAAAYQRVVTKYALKAIDFDLEEPEYENLAAISNEVGAAQILQRNNPGLYVSITTAGTASGTGYFGQNVLNTAKELGFTPNNYAIMPFDGGFTGALSQTAALEQFHTLLMNTFGWSSATAYHHEGVSMMNGRSDTGEYFHQADFQTVLNYATSHGLSRYTFWSVNRDRKCMPPDHDGVTSGRCSSVPQSDWDFTKYTVKFAGATPPQGPPPTDSPSPAKPGSCTAPPWNSTTAYTGGKQVSANGHMWTAKWWTQGDTPGNNSQGVWTDNGPCSGAPSNPTEPGTCTLPPWNRTTAYNGGTRVSFNRHAWTAKWWTQDDIPGSKSQGVWTDNGPC